MYDVPLRRIRAQFPYEGFEGAYFSAGNYRYFPLSELNLHMALSLNLISGEEAEWGWQDLIHGHHWESVRHLSQLQWMLEGSLPPRICIIRDGEQALEHGAHRCGLEAAGYLRVGSNREFERWMRQTLRPIWL